MPGRRSRPACEGPRVPDRCVQAVCHVAEEGSNNTHGIQLGGGLKDHPYLCSPIQKTSVWQVISNAGCVARGR